MLRDLQEQLEMMELQDLQVSQEQLVLWGHKVKLVLMAKMELRVPRVLLEQLEMMELTV